MKSAASVTPEEREKVHKLCAFPWGVSAIPDEVKRMLAEDVDDDPSSAEESEELDFSCSSSSSAASNPNDPQATKAVSSSVAEEVLPVSFASASFAGKEAEGKNDAGAATQPGFFDRYFGGGHGAPVAKAKKGDTPSVAPGPAKKKGRKERNAEDVQHLVSSGSPPVPQEGEVTTSGRKRKAAKAGDGTDRGWQGH